MKTSFTRKHASLNEILLDKELAKLGDAFINFIFSLAASNRRATPTNVRVPSNILAEALKKAGYRKLLPKRTDRHEQGDAVEALIIYAWLEEVLSIEEYVTILEQEVESPVEAFTDLITTIVTRLNATL